MLALRLGIKLICALWALGWAVWVAAKRERTMLTLTWAVFTVSMAGILLAEGLGDQLGAIRPWLMMVGGGTCSVFWLFTRALFRPNPQIGPVELALVAGIILPSVVKPFIVTAGAVFAFETAGVVSTLVSAQALLSSTALMLSFWEAARQWPSNRAEQTLRLTFLGSFGSAVFLCAVLFTSVDGIPLVWTTLVEALCAAMILGVCSFSIFYRQAHPLTESRPLPRATREDDVLGQRLVQLLDREQLYLDPALNLAQLAKALGETPNRVSRAITASLKAGNINQLVNARRITHAKALLSDRAHDELTILQVALESGFNSIGPFNRAFKAQTGATPREFRRRRENALDGLPAE